MVTIAIPSLSRKKLRRIFELVESAHVKVNTMPSIEELASGKISVSKLKTIDVVDLLGRDEVELDIESIKDRSQTKSFLSPAQEDRSVQKSVGKSFNSILQSYCF